MTFNPLIGRIFFLGAGFSAGAGVPLTNALLPKAAVLFSDEAPGLFDRVCDYAKQADVDLRGSPSAEDFARLCTHIEFVELREYGGGERWSDQGSHEKLALKFFLSKAIAISTPSPEQIPQHYLSFVKSITPNDVIVTFNWDLLLEAAMDQAGVPYSYSFEKEKIQIIKLHGSINWINEEPSSLRSNAPNFGYVPLGYNDGLMTNEIYGAKSLMRREKWQEARCMIDEIKPLIVLPGYGKAFDVRTLSLLWYRIEFLNMRTGGVSIIGLRVSEDDFILESLFRYLFRGVISNDRVVRVLNPDHEAISHFRRMGDGNNFSFEPKVFNDETLPFALLQ